MQQTRWIAIAVAAATWSTVPVAADAADAARELPAVPAWDPAGVGRSIAAAREAREQGDLAGAERLCYAAFDSVDRSMLVAYDAYAETVKAAHRSDEAAVRAQAAKLHALRAEREAQREPTSSYLGFAPSDGLNAYAEMLQGTQHPADAERMRSLALAYRQVQQAHFQRTMLYRQGKDPRGSC